MAAAVGLQLASAQAAPASPRAAGKPRPVKAIEADINTQFAALHANFEYYQLLGDGSRVASIVAPPAKQLIVLWEELGAGYPQNKSRALRKKCEYLAILAATKDSDAEKQLEAIAGSSVKGDAVKGEIGLALVNWWTKWPHAEDQAKSLDQIKEALAAPDTEIVGAEAISMIVDTQNMSDEQSKAVAQLIIDKLKGPANTALRTQAQNVLNRLALVGKPMAIAGRTADGKNFNSAQWKGKVIVVDFWATWCPPCRKDVPNVIKMYDDFHAKGLEIVGVSSDTELPALKTFLAGNTGMAWPQLFSTTHTREGWHPLTQRYCVDFIPTMFIIDKTGVCRGVGHLSAIEALLPKLLAEDGQAHPAAGSSSAVKSGSH
jgi:thiol-disulfide isomerase/thioredoxin